jgi:hypothetical protein
MRNLNDEYELKEIIYEGQKKYRKTPEGKEAIARANRKHRIKKKIQQLYDKSKTKSPKCYGCGETYLGFLTIDNSDVICYNCKFGIEKEELEEICQ